MRSFEFARAQSVDHSIALHGRAPDAAFVAGGTTLLDLVKCDVMRPARLVDVHRLPLTEVDGQEGGGLRIGAMVTNTALAYHPRIAADYPMLSQALLSGASRQLRNKATLGGNLMQRVRCGYFRDAVSPCNKRVPGSGCAAIGGHNRSVHAVLGTSQHCIAAHPSDMCVALAAIGATVTVRGSAGERQIDLLDFHLLPGDTPWKEHALATGELITHVTLDRPIRGGRSAYLKLRDRASYQFALASAGAILAVERGQVRDVRLALGGVGTRPWRCRSAEAAMIGRPATPETFRRAAAVAFEGAVPQTQNGFKIALGQQAIVRVLTSLAA